jgi:hypothetical protein
MRFDFIVRANSFSSLRLQYPEGVLTVPREELGLGTDDIAGAFPLDFRRP